MAATLTVEECRKALRGRYSKADGYVHLEELQNVGGMMRVQGIRRCDFWAMSIYGSRGYETHGVEIKVRRSDLVRELKDPSKAEGLAAFCDYWWLAVGDRELLDGLRIPKAWGILWPRGDNLVQKRAPERTPSADAWDRAFVAALIGRCWSSAPEKKLAKLRRQRDKAEREGYSRGYREGKQRVEDRHSELRERVDAFEAASGIKLSGYIDGRYGIREDVARHLGDAVQVLLNGSGKLDRHLHTLKRIARNVGATAEQIRGAADGLERFVEDLQDRQLDLLGGE